MLTHFLLSLLSSQCVGTTPEGLDFEGFIGPQKAKEFKSLFTAWIAKIYRQSCFSSLL
jgi:hypothetical protein